MCSLAIIATDFLPAYSDSETYPEDNIDSCSDLELDIGCSLLSSSPASQSPCLDFQADADSWVSDDVNSDFGPEDCMYRFSDPLLLPVKLDFHPYIDEAEQDMSEEPHNEGLTIPGVSIVPSQCDWSADIHPSHEKANYPPGIALTPDSSERVKVWPLKLPHLI